MYKPEERKTETAMYIADIIVTNQNGQYECRRIPYTDDVFMVAQAVLVPWPAVLTNPNTFGQVEICVPDDEDLKLKDLVLDNVVSRDINIPQWYDLFSFVPGHMSKLKNLIIRNCRYILFKNKTEQKITRVEKGSKTLSFIKPIGSTLLKTLKVHRRLKTLEIVNCTNLCANLQFTGDNVPGLSPRYTVTDLSATTWAF